MPSRRFTRRAPNFRSRFRRGRPLSTVVRTRKWNVSRIFVDRNSSLPTGAGTETLIYFHLASIASSWAASSSSTERVGTALADTMRSLELGGIVFEVEHYHRGNLPGQDGSEDLGRYDLHHALVVDRVVRETGDIPFPASLVSYHPWDSGFPTATLSASTPQEDVEPVNYPQRILWERNQIVDVRPKFINNDLEGALYVPQNQRLARHSYFVNRRLNLRLNEDQGLYLILGILNTADFALSGDERLVVDRVWGKLYWRFRT